MRHRLVTIQRGTGGGRVIPVGPAMTAIRTYLAARQEQRHADRPELWLGERSCGLAADALYRSPPCVDALNGPASPRLRHL